MIRLAVFGQPIRQSLSPRIHSSFARQCGLEIDYRAIEATAETFTSQVSQLAAEGGLGCNVTLPFKMDAWKLAAVSSDSARRARAANTLLFEAEGWYADNTDGGGLINDLRDGAQVNLSGKRVCLLGAGGAAAGVLGALLKAGPNSVIVANRTGSKAQELAGLHADLGDVQGIDLDGLEKHAPFDLFVNATSQGHHGQAPTVSASWFTDQALCYDMNYGKASQALSEHCTQAGIRYRDGLGMLVGQAALSFELWTGVTPETKAVLDELRSAARE